MKWFSRDQNFYTMVLMDALLVVSCFFLAYLFRMDFTTRFARGAENAERIIFSLCR